VAVTAHALSIEGVLPAGVPAIDAERVRTHVSHVLASPDFAAAPQLAAFLKYIVEKKLAGQEEFIKAYTIATEALGRSPDFDAQNDPIVRVQARRLRQALLLYYADPAADHTLRIMLPVGGYVPEFVVPERAPDPPVAAPAAAAVAPTVALAERKPESKPLFETKWVAPVSLVLSVLSMILSLWPELIRMVLGP
jgi:hypothetical protein